jgi:hypothetical protein
MQIRVARGQNKIRNLLITDIQPKRLFLLLLVRSTSCRREVDGQRRRRAASGTRHAGCGGDIEAEDELVEIGLKVAAPAVIDAQRPCLEVGEALASGSPISCTP